MARRSRRRSKGRRKSKKGFKSQNTYTVKRGGIRM